MGLKLVYEALEIEKLLDQEKAARDKGPIAEQTLEDEQVDEVVEKKKEETDETATSTLDTPEETADPSSEEDPLATDPDGEASETESTETLEGGEGADIPAEIPVQESLKDQGGWNLSVEDFNSGNSSTLRKTVELLQSSVAEVSSLTLQTAPKILKSMYKGVVYGVAKVKLTVGKIYSATDTSIERQKTSTAMVRKRLDALKEILEGAGTKKDGVEDMVITYRNKDVVPTLVCGSNTDIVKNLENLDGFLSLAQAALHKAIIADFNAIRYYGTVFTHGKKIDPLELVKPVVPAMGFVKGPPWGYKPSSELLQSFHSETKLPGNMVVVAELPKDDLESMDYYASAYDASRMYLGFDKEAYQEVEELKVVGIQKVKEIVSALEKLLTTCEKQQTLYEDITRTKTGVMLSIKRHAMNLVESAIKVRSSDSLVEPMYLKATFIAKVYLVGSLDIHDYAAKTISNGLSLAEELAKKYS